MNCCPGGMKELHDNRAGCTHYCEQANQMLCSISSCWTGRFGSPMMLPFSRHPHACVNCSYALPTLDPCPCPPLPTHPRPKAQRYHQAVSRFASMNLSSCFLRLRMHVLQPLWSATASSECVPHPLRQLLRHVLRVPSREADAQGSRCSGKPAPSPMDGGKDARNMSLAQTTGSRE